MKLFLKLSATLLLLVIAITALGYFLWYKPKFNSTRNAGKFVYKTTAGDVIVSQRLQQKALSVKEYSKLNQYNSDYCFMVDMKIASGKNRFFIYNLKKDSIEMAGLVANGSGRNTLDSVQFSNNANSLCTSLGKYKIGNSYNGKFGLAFKLYGLDATNSNAFNRFVVLHAHPCIPNAETAPLPICESWGCPTVAPLFLNQLKQYIDKSEKPVLLDIYY
ncbi:MAG: hypothetical protein JWR61_4258 [Ferruginibacter sp.]|uniref:murein L,D-transpeptidase catalytic domain-containing protein n=1 Tax=Ferruginibacter sp. TaxID=1940288 RepID=UPI0026588F82|nr:murein L,D-transpeptidase catalytic domain family protein [Ferruginibacter sp.]MDB5279303.1 hypothetical protein [Ferruginibacter sp.]